jgi:hypothetical protein
LANHIRNHLAMHVSDAMFRQHDTVTLDVP